MAQFNLRVGAAPVRSTAGFCTKWKRRLSASLTQLRTEPIQFFRTIVPKITLFAVYAIETKSLSGRVTLPEVAFSQLTVDELINASQGDREFRERQQRLFERFGHGHAFAARLGGELAHVSWLLSAPVSLRDEVLVLRLKTDEAEITGCETIQAFRGKGLYPYAVRELIARATTLGISRVFMKASWKNLASRRGIVGAGLSSAGFAIVVRVPGRNIRPVVMTLIW